MLCAHEPDVAPSGLQPNTIVLQLSWQAQNNNACCVASNPGVKCHWHSLCLYKNLLHLWAGSCWQMSSCFHLQYDEALPRNIACAHAFSSQEASPQASQLRLARADSHGLKMFYGAGTVHPWLRVHTWVRVHGPHHRQIL